MTMVDDSFGKVTVSDLKKKLYESIATMKSATAKSIPLFFVNICILFKPVCLYWHLVFIQTSIVRLEKDWGNVHDP
mgnify:CR=1 FL=1